MSENQIKQKEVESNYREMVFIKEKPFKGEWMYGMTQRPEGNRIIFNS